MLLPSGKRHGRDRRVAAAYLGGTLAGATFTAALAWLLSGFFAPFSGVSRAALLVVGALFAWSVKHGPLVDRVQLPEARRQIPLETFGRGLVPGAWKFGFEMGTGMRTYLPSFAPYVLLLALLLARPTLAQALLVAAGFGLGRAVPLMIHLRPEERLSLTRDFLQGADHRFAQTAAGLVVLLGALLLV